MRISVSRGVLVAAAATAAIAVLIPAQASAQQVQIGTNLQTHTPNVNFGCEFRPSLLGPFPDGTPTCTYLSVIFGEQSTASPFVAGVVTSVQVKAAAPTGPMQVTVVRQLGSADPNLGGIACCFYQGESQVFTPNPNSITTIPVRLPVESFVDIQAQQTGVDYLGLTMLQPGIPFPGQFPGNHSLEGSLGMFPRLSADNSNRADLYGNQLVPLLSATVAPLCGATGANASVELPDDSALPEPRALSSAEARQSAGACLGGVTPRAGSLSNSRVKVPLDCNLSAGCIGKLKLLSKQGGRRLGKSSFSLDPGASSNVKVKLSKAGKKAAKGKRKLKVKAKATVVGGPSESKTVKLSR